MEFYKNGVLIEIGSGAVGVSCGILPDDKFCIDLSTVKPGKVGRKLKQGEMGDNKIRIQFTDKDCFTKLITFIVESEKKLTKKGI